MCPRCKVRPLPPQVGPHRGKGYVRPTCEDCRPHKKPWRQYRKDHCESCGWAPPTVKALEVDHIVPRNAGGTNDPSNLRTLCPNCHRLKTLIERGVWGGI